MQLHETWCANLMNMASHFEYAQSQCQHGDHANSNKLTLCVLKLGRRLLTEALFAFLCLRICYLRIKICDLPRMSLDQSLLLVFYSRSHKMWQE
jgi:hypothetical protein